MQAQYRSNRLSERLTDTPREPRGTNGLCLDPRLCDSEAGRACVCEQLCWTVVRWARAMNAMHDAQYSPLSGST